MWKTRCISVGIILGLMFAVETRAQALPETIDAGRIDKRERESEQRMPIGVNPPVPLERGIPSIPPPKQSKSITLTLHEVTIEGMSAFTAGQMRDIYEPYVGHTITLDTVWLMAGQITERYHAAGYFLSRAHVPTQEVQDGNVTIQVTEGFISQVTLNDPLQHDRIVKRWLERLLDAKPLSSRLLESVLLQLNDLPGVNLRAVLEPTKVPGAVMLSLVSQPTAMKTQVSVDNNGSRYLGPLQVGTQIEGELLPMQQTSVRLLGSVPLDELKYGSIRHRIPIIAGGVVEFNASKTNAAPGFTLKSSEIRSDASSLGLSFDYSLIRQRDENLTARVALEAHDTMTDIAGSELTRDHLRVVRGNFAYERVDSWAGYNTINATVSQGISAIGASKASSTNPSRAEATPDYTKGELRLSRTQPLGKSWGVIVSASGQLASGPLYSLEEFAYGGQGFGRAYDPSEIVGDHGLAASTELRYTGLDTGEGIALAPYGFYDTGIVWNDDATQARKQVGSSAGAGIRVQTALGISGNLGVAFPLGRSVETPQYGNGKNPRYIAEVSYGF